MKHIYRFDLYLQQLFETLEFKDTVSDVLATSPTSEELLDKIYDMIVTDLDYDE